MNFIWMGICLPIQTQMELVDVSEGMRFLLFSVMELPLNFMTKYQ